MTSTKLQIELNSMPLHLRQEVADFVAFLKTKSTIKPAIKKREFGYAKGKIKLSDDFDAPLNMFADYR